MRSHPGLPEGFAIPMFLITGLSAGAANLIAIFVWMILGPNSWWAITLAAALFLWRACRPWNQPRWPALLCAAICSVTGLLVAHTTPLSVPFTILFVFLIGAFSAFTFADTVNGIGESRFLPVTRDIDYKKQRKAYRQRALIAHMLHNPDRVSPFRSFLLRDLDRPPQGSEEWKHAFAIARALNERSARRLRASWNDLVATGRPLDLIAAIIQQTDKENTIRTLTSDLPDEYLHATLAA